MGDASSDADDGGTVIGDVGDDGEGCSDDCPFVAVAAAALVLSSSSRFRCSSSCVRRLCRIASCNIISSASSLVMRTIPSTRRPIILRGSPAVALVPAALFVPTADPRATAEPRLRCPATARACCNAVAVANRLASTLRRWAKC